MVCPKLSIATSWQIIRMNNAGVSYRETGHQLGLNHIVISWLVRKYQQTNDIKVCNSPRKPRKTSPREDRALLPPPPFSATAEITGFLTEPFQMGWKLLGIELERVQFWHQHTKQHVWHGVRYATDGILQRGERFIGPMKAAFLCTSLVEELVCGVNQMPPMPPAISRKPFHLSVVLWWCGDAFHTIASWIWSLFKAILMGKDIRGTSWNSLSSLTFTSMLWPRNQCLWTTNVRPHLTRAVVDFLQWTAIITTPCLTRREPVGHSGSISTSETSSSPNVSKTVRSTAPGMVGNSTTSDPTSGLGHEHMYWSCHPSQWGLYQILNF